MELGKRPYQKFLMALVAAVIAALVSFVIAYLIMAIRGWYILSYKDNYRTRIESFFNENERNKSCKEWYNRMVAKLHIG